MGEFVSFPNRLILWLLENPVPRSILIICAIILLLGLIFPAAIYIYPVWKSVPSDIAVDPFPLDGLAIRTTVAHPARLLPGRTYRLRVEASNEVKFSQPVTVTIGLSENDPYIFFENNSSTPLIIQHTFQENETIMFTDIVEFGMDNIPKPYRSTTFQISISYRPDETLISGFDIPIDYYSIPVMALLVMIVPVVGFLIKKLFS